MILFLKSWDLDFEENQGDEDMLDTTITLKKSPSRSLSTESNSSFSLFMSIFTCQDSCSILMVTTQILMNLIVLLVDQSPQKVNTSHILMWKSLSHIENLLSWMKKIIAASIWKDPQAFHLNVCIIFFHSIKVRSTFLIFALRKKIQKVHDHSNSFSCF